MAEVKVLGEFFLSQVIGKTICDTNGRKIGRLRDIAVCWDGKSPRVTGIKYAKGIQNHIPPDEAADILGELTEEKSSEILNLMEPDEAQDVRELMEYPGDTSGSLMTTEYIAFPAELTAGKTIDRLRKLAPSAENIYYLYVIDQQEKLQGVLSLRELIIAQPEATLGEFMNTRVISVNHHDDHRKLFEVVSKYKLLAVPVVDNHNVMQGIVTVDDVMETLVPDRGSLGTFSDFMIPGRHGRGWR